MSDSHGSGSPGGGLIFIGLLTLPVVAIGNALRTNYLVDAYGTLEKIPAKELLINQNYQLGFGALLFLGLCIMFPLGVYNMAKAHMGH